MTENQLLNVYQSLTVLSKMIDATTNSTLATKVADALAQAKSDYTASLSPSS